MKKGIDVSKARPVAPVPACSDAERIKWATPARGLPACSDQELARWTEEGRRCR